MLRWAAKMAPHIQFLHFDTVIGWRMQDMVLAALFTPGSSRRPGSTPTQLSTLVISEISSPSTISTIARITSLHLLVIPVSPHGPRVNELSNLGSLSLLTSLSLMVITAYWSGNASPLRMPSHLGKLTRLRRLFATHINHPWARVLLPSSISALRQLRQLTVQHSHGAEALPRGLSVLTALADVSLSHVRLDAAIIGALPLLCAVQSFTLISIENISADLFPALARLTTLHDLHFRCLS